MALSSFVLLHILFRLASRPVGAVMALHLHCLHTYSDTNVEMRLKKRNQRLMMTRTNQRFGQTTRSLLCMNARLTPRRETLKVTLADWRSHCVYACVRACERAGGRACRLGNWLSFNRIYVSSFFIYTHAESGAVWFVFFVSEVCQPVCLNMTERYSCTCRT